MLVRSRRNEQLLVTVLGRGICSRCAALLPSPRTFLSCVVLWLWSLVRGQPSGQRAVIFGKWPSEHGSKSG